MEVDYGYDGACACIRFHLELGHENRVLLESSLTTITVRSNDGRRVNPFPPLISFPSSVRSSES